MQRFNRISAVICLLLSCAPSTYAQDNLHGETMGTAVVQIKLAGVYQHSHSGRRTYITKLANAGINVRLLAELAGHKHISTTQRYIDVNDIQLAHAVELL